MVILSAIECFHSRGEHVCKFLEQNESVCIRKEFKSHRIGLGHQHGAVSLFWDTNMAAGCHVKTLYKENAFISYNYR